MQPQPTG